MLRVLFVDDLAFDAGGLSCPDGFIFGRSEVFFVCGVCVRTAVGFLKMEITAEEAREVHGRTYGCILFILDRTSGKRIKHIQPMRGNEACSLFSVVGR